MTLIQCYYWLTKILRGFFNSYSNEAHKWTDIRSQCVQCGAIICLMFIITFPNLSLTYITLHYTTLHYTTLHYATPRRAAPRRAAPRRTAPRRTAPHRTAPHRTAPHRTAPHYIIRALMRSESIARGGLRPNGLLTQRWLRGHEGGRNNRFSKIQLVGQKYRDKTTLASKRRFSRHCFGFQSRRFSLLVDYNI